MSPEQAAGKVEELGPATDVYSLGATLYVLLTNQPPLRGEVPEVLRRTQEGSWLPPRQVNPAVPAALDAICRKAMALRPEDRYASALDLAADLDHWLADEPVAAYREPAAARLRRWMRKHPRKVTAAAVLLLAAVIGLLAGTVLLERSKREAQENFEMTRAAARKFLVAVNEEQLLDEPGMQGLRQRLLMEALDYYVAFLKKRPGDPVVRQEQAEANRQLGEVYGQVGRMGEAKSLAERSLREFEDLRQSMPTDREVRHGLAKSHLTLAELQVQSGQPEEGRDHASQAIEVLEPLRAARPNDTGLLRLLGRGYDLRATAEIHLGLLDVAVTDNADAVKFLEDALSINNKERPGILFGQINYGNDNSFTLLGGGNRNWEAFVAGPEELANSIVLGRAWINRGLLLGRAGRKTEAAQALHWATQIARALEHNNQRLRRLRNVLALSLLNDGHVNVQLGRPTAGEPALWEALEWSRRLLNDDPLVAEYRAAHAQAAGYLGEDLFLSGQTAPAAELLREAVMVADELQEGGSNDRMWHTHRARFLWGLGCLEGELGRVDSGLRYCEQARQEQEESLARAPGDRSVRSDWLRIREAIARLRYLAGQADAEAWIGEQRQILAERKELAGREPVLPYFQRESGASAAVLAELLLEQGQPQEALAVVDEVLPAHEQLVHADRLLTRLQARANERPREERLRSVAVIQDGRVAVYDSERPRAERLRSVGRLSPYEAYPTWDPGQEDFQLRRVWADLLARKGAALARTGRGAAAGECVRQAIGIAEELARGDGYFACPPCSWPSAWSVIAEQVSRQEPCYLYDLACHLALASTLPGNAGGEADRAVAALRAYSAAGFDNVHKLRTDPRLEPLRGRADFQRLVHELETRPPARKRLALTETAQSWNVLLPPNP